MVMRVVMKAVMISRRARKITLDVMTNLNKASKRTKGAVTVTAKNNAIAAAETGSVKKSAINAWMSFTEVMKRKMTLDVMKNLKEVGKRKITLDVMTNLKEAGKRKITLDAMTNLNKAKKRTKGVVAATAKIIAIAAAETGCAKRCATIAWMSFLEVTTIELCDSNLS